MINHAFTAKFNAITLLLAMCMGLMACATPPQYRITEAIIQPSGETVNGLQLSVSTDKTDLKIKPDANDKGAPKSYDFDPVWLTLTFTNASDKVIKLDLYEWDLFLKGDVSGPDSESLRVENRRPYARRPWPISKIFFPTLDPGKSLTLLYGPSFPEYIGDIEYTPLKHGEYHVKVIYTGPSKHLDAEAARAASGSWAGSVTSNEIVLRWSQPK